MIRHRTRSASFVLLAALALCACSDDDDDDPNPNPSANTITPENATAGLGPAANAIFAILRLSDMSMSFVQPGGGGPVAPQGAGGPETMDCSDGGSVTLSFTDVAPTDELSAGDTFNVTFEDCTEGETTLDGSLSLVVDEHTQGKELTTLGLSILVGDLTVMNSGQTVAQDGAISQLLEVNTSTGDAGYTMSGFLDTSFTENGATFFANLSNIDLGVDYFAEMMVEAVRVDCTYETNTFTGTSFTVTTLEDFVTYGDDDEPTEGRLSLAAGGDTLYMTAQPDGVNVLLELDQDTDGTIDWTELVPWDEL